MTVLDQLKDYIAKVTGMKAERDSLKAANAALVETNRNLTAQLAAQQPLIDAMGAELAKADADLANVS